MEASAQAVPMGTAGEVRGRRLRLSPVGLLMAIVIAVIAVSVVAGPTFAQEDGVTGEAGRPLRRPRSRPPNRSTWPRSAPASPSCRSSARPSASASSPACRRAPSVATQTPASQIRSLAVLMAAFAEGLGVIALVVGLLIVLLGS